MNIADLAITSLETITCYDTVTGDYKFTIDELQKASIAQSQDQTEITGKQGRRLATLKKNKSITISGTNGLVSCGLIALQTGCDFESKTAQIAWTDYLTVNASHEATTSYTAIGTAGAEITACFIREDGVLTTELVQDSTASAGKFAYTAASKKLQFHTDINNGTEVVVFYKRSVANAAVLENKSDKYSAKCAMYIDALAEDRCTNVYRVQIYIPKADFKGDFTLDMGDSQTVQNFEAESLAGACKGADALWTYTVFGATAGDPE